MAQRIVVLATGGTVSGRASSSLDNVGYAAGQVGVSELVQGLGPVSGLSLELEQVAQVDSKDMGFDLWRLLARRCAYWLAQPEVQGIVVTHGTDTLEETAWFLQCVLDPDKPVVLTCAMRPASSLASDGPQNLMDAMSVARHAGARGVVAVCAGVVHGAVDVHKQHTYRLDPFSSGDAGPVGYVEEGCVRGLRDWPRGRWPEVGGLVDVVEAAMRWPWVEVVTSHAGASAATVEALVAHGVEGLVVAGTGNGTVHHDLEAALLRHQAAGLPVLRASRCEQGRVISIPGAALADSNGLSSAKARISLMLDLLARRR